MPRRTNKTRSKFDGKSCGSQTNKSTPLADVVSKKAVERLKRENAVKQVDISRTSSSTEQVCHRKSERRRVARDIFLVFEEQPKNYGKTRGSNKKLAKPKFGHLNVGEPTRTKGLLRDIKNEPKCCLIEANNNKLRSKKCGRNSLIEKKTNQLYDVWSSTSCPPVKAIYSKIESMNTSCDTDFKKSMVEETPIVARVNPIFLWAKQDNSRIIEVRCEDYDRRNRIRITKTSNGWRAIPRSDPTSTKILKFYSSPLIKVKRESLNIIAKNISQTPVATFSIESKPNSNSLQSITMQDMEEKSQIENPLNRSKSKSRKKKSKKRKKENNCKDIGLSSGNQCDKKESPASEDACTDNYTPNDDFNQHICNIQQKASTLKRRSSPNIFGLTEEEKICDEYTYQLCPKTGIFLRFHKSYEDGIEIDEYNDIENLEMTGQIKTVSENKTNSIEENAESLEAKTRNLKDLLDDADLFQNCDDNANNGSDLIDTLVKSSCESNLLHDSETCIKEGFGPRINKDGIDIPEENEDLAQIINEVSEPPKCLSFNEAGEIEALNCDLFQSNTYIEPFEKQVAMPLNSVLELPTKSNSTNPFELENSDKSNYCNNNVPDDSPKDLSYKKREEVCPPSESRSQCAVTSSSDIIKSPNLDETSVLATSSETLKSLILEQFMKLSNISKQKKNHVDLSKMSEPVQLSNTIFPKCIGTNLNDIQTYIIDDDDVRVEVAPNEDLDGPLKKRLRSGTVVKQNIADVDKNIKAKMAMIDKDPDPLTQLRLLIKNSQWKVPDPILVPKDRLSAVLASPAREIPLLITTRPELRLPEAFAYPEIIQNPNILVISMAQLEAILKNNQEDCMKNTSQIMLNDKQRTFSKKSADESTKPIQQCKQLPNISELHPRENTFTSELPEEITDMTSLSHNSVLPSDLNAATMAILNQMLWIPYFGQFSRDLNSIKAPSKITENGAGTLPPEPHNLEHMFTKNEQNTHSSAPVIAEGLNEISNPTLLKDRQIDGMTLFHKVLQQQMQNVINLNLSKGYTVTKNSSDLSSLQKNGIVEGTVFNGVASRNSNSAGCSNNIDTEISLGNVFDAGKTYNLRSSVASRQNSGNNHFANMNRSNLSSKPRVTCKSLSNLLEPDLNQPQTAITNSNNALPTVSNVENNYMHDINGLRIHMNNKKSVCRFGENAKDSKIKSLAKTCISKGTDIYNEYNKQSNKSVHDTPESGVRNADPPHLSTETNVPLWHPLFGSNSKSAYSSPWQWTTVTTAGE